MEEFTESVRLSLHGAGGGAPVTVGWVGGTQPQAGVRARMGRGFSQRRSHKCFFGK